MRLDAREIVHGLDAKLVCPTPLPETLAVSIDTRSLQPGDLYVALRGERFDGHQFIGEAVDKGAAAVMVDDPGAIVEGLPALIVPNTKRAYMMLAHLARMHLHGPVLAITGSTGKTTTKAFLRDLLGGANVDVVATPENENNEIGVSKFFLGLERDSEATLVVEMGARHPHDIAALVNVAEPGFGILTNIGEAHLEIFGTREAIAEAKWELFGNGAAAILNIEDAASRARGHTLLSPPRYFGTGPVEAPPHGHATIVRDALTLEVVEDGASAQYPIEVHLPGAHNLANLAAAFAGAIALGVPPERLAPLASTLVLPHGRYEVTALPGGVRVIFDAYNASLSGTLATLHAFLGERAKRRIVVFGSMAELGAEARQMHHRIGVAAAEGEVDVILAGGRFAAEILQGARDIGARGELVTYEENAQAVAWLREHLREGDVVLLKGSRMYRMEEIFDGIRGSRV